MLHSETIMEVAMKVLGLGVLTLLLACGEEEKADCIFDWLKWFNVASRSIW